MSEQQAKLAEYEAKLNAVQQAAREVVGREWLDKVERLDSGQVVLSPDIIQGCNNSASAKADSSLTGLGPVEVAVSEHEQVIAAEFAKTQIEDAIRDPYYMTYVRGEKQGLPVYPGRPDSKYLAEQVETRRLFLNQLGYGVSNLTAEQIMGININELGKLRTEYICRERPREIVSGTLPKKWDPIKELHEAEDKAIVTGVNTTFEAPGFETEITMETPLPKHPRQGMEQHSDMNKASEIAQQGFTDTTKNSKQLADVLGKAMENNYPVNVEVEWKHMSDDDNRRLRESLAYGDFHSAMVRGSVVKEIARRVPAFDFARKAYLKALRELSELIYEHPLCVREREAEEGR